MTALRHLKYVAVVEHVQEVILYGTADLGFWTERLVAEGLQPSDNSGRAEVLISATNLKWRGWRFREFTISIGVMTAPADAAASAIHSGESSERD